MSALALANFVYGAIGALCWIVGLFFIGFWRKTGDRFFGIFAAGFWMLGLGRLAMSTLGQINEMQRPIYVFRLVAYLVFLAAIVDKNRGSTREP